MSGRFWKLLVAWVPEITEAGESAESGWWKDRRISSYIVPLTWFCTA